MPQSWVRVVTVSSGTVLTFFKKNATLVSTGNYTTSRLLKTVNSNCQLQYYRLKRLVGFDPADPQPSCGCGSGTEVVLKTVETTVVFGQPNVTVLPRQSRPPQQSASLEHRKAVVTVSLKTVLTFCKKKCHFGKYWELHYQQTTENCQLQLSTPVLQVETLGGVRSR